MLHLRCWSVMLSNQLMHPSFQHPLRIPCSKPCCCYAMTACCDAPCVTDMVQTWGYGESVKVSFKAEGAVVAVDGAATRRTALDFTAPLSSIAMARAATTPAQFVVADDPKRGPAVPGEPVNDSVSYAELRMQGDPRQALTMNCSLSTVSRDSMAVGGGFRAAARAGSLLPLGI